MRTVTGLVIALFSCALVSSVTAQNRDGPDLKLQSVESKKIKREFKNAPQVPSIPGGRKRGADETGVLPDVPPGFDLGRFIVFGPCASNTMRQRRVPFLDTYTGCKHQYFESVLEMCEKARWIEQSRNRISSYFTCGLLRAAFSVDCSLTTVDKTLAARCTVEFSPANDLDGTYVCPVEILETPWDLVMTQNINALCQRQE